MTTPSSPLDALENQYFFLRDNLSTLKTQVPPGQASDLDIQVEQSRTNYQAAVKGALDADDATVKALVTQLTAEQDVLDASVEHLGSVAKVLDAVTKAVSIGSQLAAKIAAV